MGGVRSAAAASSTWPTAACTLSRWGLANADPPPRTKEVFARAAPACLAPIAASGWVVEKGGEGRGGRGAILLTRRWVSMPPPPQWTVVGGSRLCWDASGAVDVCAAAPAVPAAPSGFGFDPLPPPPFLQARGAGMAATRLLEGQALPRSPVATVARPPSTVAHGGGPGPKALAKVSPHIAALATNAVPSEVRGAGGEGFPLAAVCPLLLSLSN